MSLVRTFASATLRAVASLVAPRGVPGWTEQYALVGLVMFYAYLAHKRAERSEEGTAVALDELRGMLPCKIDVAQLRDDLDALRAAWERFDGRSKAPDDMHTEGCAVRGCSACDADPELDNPSARVTGLDSQLDAWPPYDGERFDTFRARAGDGACVGWTIGQDAVWNATRARWVHA